MFPNFQRIDLTETTPVRLVRFDIVCAATCSSGSTKAAIVESLIDDLAPGGYLFLGHAESLHGLTDRMQSIAPAVFGSRHLPRRARAA